MVSNRPKTGRALRSFIALCAASIAALLLALPAQADTSSDPRGGGYRVSWSTLDAGGGRAVGPMAAWRLDGTLGQIEPETVPLCSADGGAACAGAEFTLRGGFWPGLQPAAPGAGCAGLAGCVFRDGFEPAAPGSTVSTQTPR